MRESELRLSCPAQSSYVAPIRHALGAFLEALQFDRNVRDDVTTAAGEALTNAVEHAYARSLEPGSAICSCWHASRAKTRFASRYGSRLLHRTQTASGTRLRATNYQGDNASHEHRHVARHVCQHDV